MRTHGMEWNGMKWNETKSQVLSQHFFTNQGLMTFCTRSKSSSAFLPHTKRVAPSSGHVQCRLGILSFGGSKDLTTWRIDIHHVFFCLKIEYPIPFRSKNNFWFIICSSLLNRHKTYEMGWLNHAKSIILRSHLCYFTIPIPSCVYRFFLKICYH